MNIAEQAAAFAENLAAHAPAEIAGAFREERAELAAAGAPATPTAGSPMPDGELLDVHGEPTTLAAARAGGPAVVVFYRGAWCPYCNITLRTYQEQLAPELRAAGATLIAISPQHPDGSLSMREANDLTFTVLSDPGNKIAGALGILTAPTADAIGAQATLGLDLTALNADGTRMIPMPTTVIVDAAGAIRWIDVHPDYATRSEPDQILEALRTLAL